MIVRHALALASVAFLVGCHGDAPGPHATGDGGPGAETRAEAGGDRDTAADAYAALPDTLGIGVDAHPDTNSPVTTDSSMPDGPTGVEVHHAADTASTIDSSSSPDKAADTGAGADLAIADAATGAPDANGERPEGGGSADSGCSPGGNISVDKLPAIDFLAYHDQSWIENYLQAVASALPAIAQYKVLGQSGRGRDLPYLVINATCQASPPAVFTNGTHHGDEPASTESVLAIPNYLLRKSTTDTAVRGLLAAYAFYVLPLVNPDGFALNTRENADGADINRDYSYPDRSDADSFKTVEARLVKSLQESVGFHAAIAFHSGAQEVVWPWCYTGDATADAGFFMAAGQKTAQAMSFAIYQQSYDDYPSEGEYIDFAYWRSHSLAATFEVSTVKTPSVASLAGVVDGSCKGTAAWIQAVNDHDKGSLHGLPGTPAERRRFPLTAPFDGTNRLE